MCRGISRVLFPASSSSGESPSRHSPEPGLERRTTGASTACSGKTMRLSPNRRAVRLPVQAGWFTGVAILVLLLFVGGMTIDGFLSIRNLLTIGALGMLVTLSALGQTFVVIS